MVLRVCMGYLTSQPTIQKRICCSLTQRVSNVGINNFTVTEYGVKNCLNIKPTRIKTDSKPQLSFEKFKKTKIESFEEFSNSDVCEILYNNNIEKMKKAYEKYCHLLYSTYKLADKGNPLHVI